MTCYTPFIRKELKNRPKIKALDGHYYYKALITGTHKDYNRTELEEITDMYDAKVIPCGHCIGCRLEYAKEWANRGYLESKLHKESWFLTLTYNDESLPQNNSLNKKDLTLFIKRLRKRTKQKISYMACGEYGEEGQRPHYHIILFGLHLEPDDLYNCKILNHENYWESKTIDKCWIVPKDDETRKPYSNMGFGRITPCTWNTINYTARYITKKVYGKKAEEYYGDRIPEYMVTSRKPAIGRNYYEQNKDKIYNNDSIIIKNTKGITENQPPKYFDDLLKKEDETRLNEIKRIRNKKQKSIKKAERERRSLTDLEQLAVEERYTANRSIALIRAMEKAR